jgi:hypothetical protein
MVWVQKTRLPANQIMTYNIQDFSGGLNNRSTLIAPNQASEIMNMSFYDNILLEKRQGTDYFDSYNHREPITFLHEFMPYTEANQLISASTTKMTFMNDSTPFDVTLSNGVDGENFQGKYFFVDGSTLRVYGKFPSVTNTFIRIVGTPNMNYNVFTVVSTPSTYTPLDATYTQGVTVYDYTNKQVWYEPCANEKSDPYKGVSVVQAGVRYITSLNGRLYMSGANRDNDNIFISEVSNPYYWPPALPIQIPPNSDNIVGLVTYDNAVVVGRTRDIHVITGTTNNPELGLEVFQLQKLNTHTGFVNNKGVNVAHNYLFFVGHDGECYALSSARNDTKVLSTTLLSRTLGFNLEPYFLTLDDVKTACSYFHNGVWYVSIKGFVFVYHYITQAWTAYDSLNIRSFHNKDGVLMWGNDSGRLVVFSTGYTDSGNPYKAYWRSGLLDMGDAISYKQFRDMFIVAHQFTGYASDIHVGVELDYSLLKGLATVSSAQPIWGMARFGDKYNSNRINTSSPFTIGRRARTVRISLRNGYKYLGEISTLMNAPIDAKDGDICHVWLDNNYYVYDKANGTWNVHDGADFNQPMRAYQINGEYELRGKR